jgi:hypothetical protein
MSIPRTVAGAAIVLMVAGGVTPPATSAPFTPEARAAAADATTLDALLAPIALYPDQLLAQLLLCSTDPIAVRQLDAFLKTNASLSGTALQEAVRAKGFEPSFVMLALFPDVVAKMAIDQNWTMQLGEAFTNDRAGVMASVQRLRGQSKSAGTLKSSAQQTVETKTTSSGETVIVIEPANPQVVYVPQYNPTTVYTTAPSSTTVVVQQESSSTGAAVAGAAVGFAAGIAIGAAFDNDYYYGPYGWHGGPAMYNDAWDDWYDDREDAREDWYENREDAREDMYENRENARESANERRESASQQRSERASTQQQQRSERQQSGQASAPTQAERDQRRADAQGRVDQARTGSATSASTASSGRTREQTRATPERKGTSSDAFSNYSSGRSERAASSRGQRSRSSSGGSRGGRRR